ncbi:hypothetical protein ABL78_2988 [Leptomonas seymouri]|uniref:Proteasome activator complex subunit 4 C-terminal domain-containing protein n=1 Tax=Leptomonas seymouri TaxID=5684 RepID=A0A0N1HYH0_LEPSE|nr:hypothetical protein ABL78_2988 [Leptomonas seymouri]|eukprot:KPI87910.1 hypothetical protein ABL78_2988 [Leptomonas seymouri]
MSSTSSYGSELTSSCSSNVAETEMHPCSDASAAYPNPNAQEASFPSCLSDASATDRPPSITAGDEQGLLRHERIHRYIDQCVAPDLIAHQRATDGRLLAQLCEELAQFGGPEEWAKRLPSNIFSGSVCEPPSEAEDACNADGVNELPFCISAGGLYCSEDVPTTWEADVRAKCDDGYELPAGAVPWDSLTCHLHQLVTRLNQLITCDGSHFPSYTLPFRLQARVTPLLYAWATCWPLVGANVRCWKSVVKAFHAACGAHQPPKDQLLFLSADAPPASRTSSSPLAEQPKAKAGVAPGYVKPRVRYAFSLPWKPLAALFSAVLEPSNSRLISWAAVVAAVRCELPELCRRASPFFTPGAVDGLWGFICSDLQRSSRGVAALSLFVQLVPYRHLCEPSAVPPHICEEEKAEGRECEGRAVATSSAPCLTARARQLLQFFLVEAAAWSPPSPPVASVVTRQGRRKERRRLLMPWRTAVIFFVSSIARAHPSVKGLDDYAEPLFTSWLNALALPIDSSAGMPGAAAAAAVSRVVRGAAAVATSCGTAGWRGGHSGVGGAGGSCGGSGEAEMRSKQIEWAAMPYVRLLNAFPDSTESPLWRQLERWIHATRVLVRPGLPCTQGGAVERVCECYRGLAREALHRVPKGSLGGGEGAGHRQGITRSDDCVATGNATEAGSFATSRMLSARYWSPSTIEKFVQLFLPLAVAAFLTRAKTASDFLICLLYMSPTVALPALLKCVDTGLNSPTEVVEQRRLSAELLRHTIVTLFTDDERFSAEVTRSARETVSDYFQGCNTLLLSLISPSTPEIAFSIFALLGVAVSYIPTHMIMRSPFEAEAFGTEYAARVTHFFAERGVERDGTHATDLKHIEAVIAALPPSATAMVTRAVLREAQSRDYGSRMSALVRTVADVAPADAWKCAEKTWLPVLHDPSADDAEAEWAGALLAACVLGISERRVVRARAADIVKAVHVQLRFLTSKTRRGVAVQLTHALVSSLMRPRWTASSHFDARKGRQHVGSAEAVLHSEDGSPLPPMAAMRTGAATAARVSVEWPDAKEDVRLAVEFFNDMLRDLVLMVVQAKRIRVCSPGAAAAVDAPSLSRRFLVDLDHNGKPATPSPDREPRCVSESASAVTPSSVLEGALEWMLRLLEIFEWIYVAPSPSVAKAATADATVDAARRGIHWGDLNPRSASRAVRLPDGCQPAYSRAEIFEVVYTHLCLPLIDYHVLTPLRGAGVELQPFLLPLLPSLDAVVPATAQDDAPSGGWREDCVVDWSCVRGLLRWLVLSGIDCPQHFWLPSESFFRLWSKVSLKNPACRSRKRIPLNGWASRAVQLHVEASVAGHLPVSQETLTLTVTVLQCLGFSPHTQVRLPSLRLLIHDKLINSLNAASLALFVQRQHALSAVVLARQRVLHEEHVAAASRSGPPSAPATPSPLPSPPPPLATPEGHAVGASPPSPATLSLPQRLLHTLQESGSGTFFLFFMMSSQDHCTKAPWWGLRACRTLVTFPEEVRTKSAVRLLPFTQKAYAMLPLAGTITSRSPQYLEELIQLASSLVTAHPMQAVVLLTLANRLYWPSSQRWISLHVVRLLTRLAVAAHVEVRSRATELLGAMAVHVSVPEVRVPVLLLDCTEDGGSVQVPSYLLLSEGGVAELDEDDRQRHHEALHALQASLQRLKDVLPLLPQYMKDRGQVFPMCTITLPKSAALAAGLPLLSREHLTSPQSCFVDTPGFVNALAGELPVSTQFYREQWSELLLGANICAAGAHDVPRSSPSPSSSPLLLFTPAMAPVTVSGGDTPWALRVLTLPMERPLAGAAQEASPSSLVSILASTHDGSDASTQRETELLVWAESRLERWETEQRTAHRDAEKDNAGPSTEAAPRLLAAGAQADGDASADSAGPHRTDEDEMHRLFLSVLTVAIAVVQFTSAATPAVDVGSHAVTAAAALRTRALRLFVSALTCLCSHAAVPHVIMRFMTFLGASVIHGFLCVEETWSIIANVSENLRSTPVEEDDSQAAAPAKRESDTWSQRQLRLITVVLTLVQAVPLAIVSPLLPRLVLLVGEHAPVFFMSPADQVRQCASRLNARLIATGYLRSSAMAEYRQCYPAAQRLFCALLGRVNAQVFQGKLPFAFALMGGEEVAATKAAQLVSPAPMADAPTPSPATSPSPEDIALLTTAVLSIQEIPVDAYLHLVDDIVVLLFYSLDLSFTSIQHLHEVVEAALQSLVTSWMPKANAHRLLEHLCAVCTGSVGYGVSRRSKAACTRALRVVVFRNLHRIGKYAMMLRVGDAALASLAHRSDEVRSEGSRLYAILTKVASEAQSRAMVQSIGSEYRLLTKKAATESPPPPPSPPPHVRSARAQLSEVPSIPPSSAEVEGVQMNCSLRNDPSYNRCIAVVQALGAVVLADPGAPSPYVPKLMEVLAVCAREGNTECGRLAKRVFEQWWHTHREGWEQEYRRYFTAEQVGAMMDLLLAPRYYA